MSCRRAVGEERAHRYLAAPPAGRDPAEQPADDRRVLCHIVDWPIDAARS
jgi:hypothetical protein